MSFIQKELKRESSLYISFENILKYIQEADGGEANLYDLRAAITALIFLSRSNFPQTLPAGFPVRLKSISANWPPSVKNRIGVF